MNEAVVIVGIVCVAAAVVGGGVRLAGGQFPVISSVPRQMLLGAVGIAAIILGAALENGQNEGTSAAPTRATSSTATTTRSAPRNSDGVTPSSAPPTSPLVPPATHLSDLEPIPGYEAYMFLTGQAKVDGTTYSRAVLLDPSREDPGHVEYDLSRKYVSFETILGLMDDVPSDTAMQFEIFGDGNEIFKQTLRLGEAVPVSVNVAGVLRLRLQVTDLSENYPYEVFAVFGEARLVE